MLLVSDWTISSFHENNTKGDHFGARSSFGLKTRANTLTRPLSCINQSQCVLPGVGPRNVDDVLYSSAAKCRQKFLSKSIAEHQPGTSREELYSRAIFLFVNLVIYWKTNKVIYIGNPVSDYTPGHCECVLTLSGQQLVIGLTRAPFTNEKKLSEHFVQRKN